VQKKGKVLYRYRRNEVSWACADEGRKVGQMQKGNRQGRCRRKETGWTGGEE
jgi:hypothetical protein